MVKLPDSYISNMKDLLSNEYTQYEESFNNPRYYGLRVNTNKISVEDFLKISPFKLEPIPWTNDGFYYNDEIDKPSKHPYYYAGLYYLQEPSAMLPAQVLNINEYDKVLDGCAAPGGKSIKLANKLKDTGVLFSNDISASRCKALIKNIELAGIKNAIVISEDITKLENKYSNYFDKILIDAPCSGEGMFRKDPSLIKSWLEKGNEYYADIQKNIIVSAINMLKDGGELVYSTCTFSPLEDEEIIKYALNTFPSLKHIELDLCEGFVRGIDNIGIKLFPHKIKGEGHFVCLLKKGDSIISNTINKNETFFKEANLNMKLNNGSYMNINEKLYYYPNVDTNGIRVMRSGLLLGENNKNGFIPSSALAMSLKKEESDYLINFNCDDYRVIKYLKGETIDIKDKEIKNGYALICVDNFPLGFAKITNGIFKNKYPKEWQYK